MALHLTGWVEANRARIVSDLVDWLRIPSISARPDRGQDVRRSARRTAELMAAAGLEQVQVLETPGHPSVYGEWCHAGPDAPMAVVYGHHDVQPVDPEEEWSSPPFQPVLADGECRARGAIDDKGQVLPAGGHQGFAGQRGWPGRQHEGAGRRGGGGGQPPLRGPAPRRGPAPGLRVWARPSCDVVGIAVGYAGPGIKTIVPAQGQLKVTFRLVADQAPARVGAAFRDWVAPQVPLGVGAEVTAMGAVGPALTPVEHPAVGALSRAIEAVWGRPPLFTRERGSGPEEALGRVLGAPVLFLGVGLPGDRIHALNERMVMDQFWKGLLAAGQLWHELAALGPALGSG